MKLEYLEPLKTQDFHAMSTKSTRKDREGVLLGVFRVIPFVIRNS